MKYLDLVGKELHRIARVVLERYKGRVIYVPSEDGDGTLLYLDDVSSDEDTVSLHGNTRQETDTTVTADRRTLEQIREAVHIRTFGDLMNHVLDSDTRKKCDTALQRHWRRDFRDVTGHDPRQDIVWHAEDGRPIPLTWEAQSAILKYNRKTGTCYTVNEAPTVDLPRMIEVNGSDYLLRP